MPFADAEARTADDEHIAFNHQWGGAASHSPYARFAPSPQQTVDLFAGKWASAFPESLGVVASGGARLFEDPRVPWAIDSLRELGVNLEGSHVLELGPLEGGHTYMLSRAGVGRITAIEAHPEAFLKCLVTKELLGVERAQVRFGDAVAFLRETRETFDCCFACGFLYHMTQPVELLRLIAARCRSLFLWTVYWDAEFSRTYPDVRAGSDGCIEAEIDGHTYRLHRHVYGEGVNYSTFWGGAAPHAYWMEKDEILSTLRRFGFQRLSFLGEPNPNGAALRLVAAK